MDFLLRPFQNPTELLLLLPAIFFSLTVHEFAHAFIAFRLGDPTANNAGRMTLNPFAHLDLIGTLCMIYFKVGWAKPVPIDPRYFSKPKRDILLVSLAGPLSNLLLAIIFGYAYVIVFKFNLVASHDSLLLVFLQVGQWINLVLMVFNLIPIPPLDGSKILASSLPPRLEARYFEFSRHASTFLIVIFVIGAIAPRFNVLSFLLGPVVGAINNLLYLLLFSYL